MQYKIGDIIEGKISGVQRYGAFVDLDEKNQGLIHVSEIQDDYIKNIWQTLHANQKIRVQVINIDEYSKKISLSIRSLSGEHKEVKEKTRKRYFTNNRRDIGFSSIEKELDNWVEEALREIAKKFGK